MIPRIGTSVAAMLMVAMTACASTPTVDPPPAAATSEAPSTDVIMITVNHNKMDQGEMTVYIEPAGGIRSVLGLINTNELKTFNYKVTGSRNIRLAAMGASGGGVTSPAITVPAGSGLNWDMTVNTVRLRR